MFSYCAGICVKGCMRDGEDTFLGRPGLRAFALEKDLLWQRSTRATLSFFRTPFIWHIPIATRSFFPHPALFPPSPRRQLSSVAAAPPEAEAWRLAARIRAAAASSSSGESEDSDDGDARLAMGDNHNMGARLAMDDTSVLAENDSNDCKNTM